MVRSRVQPRSSTTRVWTGGRAEVGEDCLEGFIARSFSCQIGKGTTAARECSRQLVNRHRYVLKCDVSKFFPNIDHKIVMGLLAEQVECPGVLQELVRHVFRGSASSSRLGCATEGSSNQIRLQARGLTVKFMKSG